METVTAMDKAELRAMFFETIRTCIQELSNLECAECADDSKLWQLQLFMVNAKRRLKEDARVERGAY